MCCACVHGALHLHNINTKAWGPTPTGVAVSPNGCQSLLVTWTHHPPTSPLTLNHYRVSYQPQGGSQQTVTTTSQGSYTLTGLAPATTYTVRVDTQTQLGYGDYCCTPTTTTHNGEASSMDTRSQGGCGTLQCIITSQSLLQVKTCIPVYWWMSVGVIAIICIILHPISTCNTMLIQWSWNCVPLHHSTSQAWRWGRSTL